MESFGIANLITLGIVVLVLIFFRLLDKSNRSLEKARKYAERCKEDIAAFVDEKRELIKGYGIGLEVERKAAAELMRRIQVLTREELAQKVDALSQIDERIRLYDASLEELVQMTGRVQENLNRIRDESSFVESVGKRVSDIREKVEDAESEIGSINEKLGAIEEHFVRENDSALGQAVEDAISSARSAVMDFEANAQAIERKIDKYREAIETLEKDRENRLARDEGRIERLLAEAIDRAGSRADKVEDAALAKLRDQAQERLNHIKSNFEEKIRGVQDTVKTKLGEVQDQLKNGREEWKAETAAFEARQKVYSDDWKKDLQDLTAFAKQQREEWNKDIGQFTGLAKQQAEELDGAIKKQREDWEASCRDIGQEIIAAAEHKLEEYRLAQDEQFNQLSGVSGDINRLEEELRQSMQEAINRVNGDFARYGEDIRGKWEGISGEFNGHLETVRGDLAGVDRELSVIKEKSFENVSIKLKGFEDEFLANLSKRSAEIDSQLASWQEDLGEKLGATAKEALRQSQQDTETRIRYMETSSENFRKEIEEWQAKYSTAMKELDSSMEDTRHRNNVLVEENTANITAVRNSLEEVRKEIAAQTKLFERTDTLKAELDRHVEDMSGNIERISQLKNEITRFENQFAQIKRLEDEVNAKMTRFMSEKHRIEQMETDFNRLLQTSRSVEEKLSQVSNSDDILQTMQVQLRRLDDVIKETEEKYQRVERKSKTMLETTNGIDRNFKMLQEEEATVKRLSDTVAILQTELDSVQKSVETLNAENEKARDAADKLSTLDDSVKWLEKRIAEMNAARESLARMATELQNLDKDAQTQLKLTRSLLDRETGKMAGRGGGKGTDEGAPPPRDRENIINLKRKGWSIDEIARTMGISRGEVELTLEIGMKDA
ncbi:MAG: hypothetical protein FWG46_04640 [Treponema sp.]|nr:hypothetical protein [Treponema sp.]